MCTCCGRATPPRRCTIPGCCSRCPPSVRIHAAFTPELPFAFRQAVWNWLTGRKRRSQPEPPSRPISAAGPAGLVEAPGGRTGAPDSLPRAGDSVGAVRFARGAAHHPRARHRYAAGDRAAVFGFGGGHRAETRIPASEAGHRFPRRLAALLPERVRVPEERLHRPARARIEREAVELSDLVVVVTRGMLRDIRARYPDQDSHKFAYIPNGYDPAKMPAPHPRRSCGQRGRRSW